MLTEVTFKGSRLYHNLVTEAEAVTIAAENPKHSGWGGSDPYMWDEGVDTLGSVGLYRRGDARSLELSRQCLASVEGRAYASDIGCRNETYLSVVGGSVSVGAYLAGAPECFRRKRRSFTGGRTVRVYVSCCSLWSIPSEYLRRRGAAVTGLILGLQARGYGVSLVVVKDSDSGVTEIPFDVSALWEARIAHVLGHPAFSRNVAYIAAKKASERAGDPYTSILPGGSQTDMMGAEWEKSVRELVGAKPTDIWLCGVGRQCREFGDDKAVGDWVERSLSSF